MARKNNFWLGMIVGAAAGAVSALLYAPKKGTEFREDIKGSAQEVGRKAGAAWGEVKERGSGAAATAQEKMREAAGKSREAVGRARSRVGEAMQVGKQAAEEKRDELQAQLQEEKSRAGM